MTDIADAFLDALDSGRSVASPQIITVYFMGNGESWTEGSQTHVSNGWSSFEINQAMAALQTWANVANISFQVTNNPSSADFRLGTYDIGNNVIGYFYPPGTYNEAGIGAFDDAYSGWSTQGLSQGGHGFNLLLHEFGHGLGLDHPHHDHHHANDAAFPGVEHIYDLGDNNLNQSVFTVMSYVRGWQDAPGIGATTTLTYGYMSTPMAFDIAAIQEKYGVNTNYASGNTIYSLPDANTFGTSYSAIWDTGGVDTIQASGSGNAVIDLRPATLQNEIGGGGWVSHFEGIHGGFTIANGVIIENAVGGNGDDIITGNRANNTLIGNSGDDSLNDSVGRDTLRGGNGNDTLSVGTGINTLFGGAGNDLLLGGAQGDSLYGGDGKDGLQGDLSSDFWGGSDTLNGGPGDDILMGGIGADTFVFSPYDGEDTIAQFDDGSFNPGNVTPGPATGSDFQIGIDTVALDGFGAAVSADVMSFVTLGQNGQIFSAEGTTITFFGITHLSVDDFIFV